MENVKTETQNKTPKTGAEYLRQLADTARNAGFSNLPVNAFDIEAAADKIEQQEKELAELKRDKQAIIDSRREDNDRLADAIMAVIGDRVEAIADDMTETVADHVRDNFDITEYEYQIHEMIDDKVPEQKDEDEQREAVESIVKEVLSGATLTIDF